MPVHDRDQNIVDAPSLEIVDDLEPKFRALGLLNLEADDLFLSIGIEGKRDINRFVFDKAFIANYDLPIPTKPPGCNGIMPPGIPE